MATPQTSPMPRGYITCLVSSLLHVHSGPHPDPKNGYKSTRTYQLIYCVIEKLCAVSVDLLKWHKALCQSMNL